MVKINVSRHVDSRKGIERKCFQDIKRTSRAMSETKKHSRTVQLRHGLKWIEKEVISNNHCESCKELVHVSQRG